MSIGVYAASRFVVEQEGASFVPLASFNHDQVVVKKFAKDLAHRGVSSYERRIVCIHACMCVFVRMWKNYYCEMQ